jgi:phosphatidylinositol alpha-mannosyltransferase
MRIVEVSPYDMGRPGGVQNHLRDLAGWLGRQGHEAIIVAPRGSGGPDGNVLEIGRQRLFGLHGTVTEISFAGPADMAKLRQAMSGFRPDLVHLHTPWTPLLPWQVWRALSVSTVSTFHATLPDPRSLMGRGLLTAARYFLRNIDAAIAPSHVPARSLPAGPGLADVKIIPPAVDLSPWFEAGAHGRERPDLESPLVVFLGRLEHRKGVDVLMQAWPDVSQAFPRGRLVIAGSGPLEPAVVAWCEGRAGVSRLPAPDAASARALLGQASILVAPSRYGESFGIVLAEAMAAGAAPVAAANDGYADTLAGPHAGDLLFPPDDARALTARIAALLAAPALLASIRGWGLERARALDISTIGPRYESLFQAVLDRRAQLGRDRG